MDKNYKSKCCNALVKVEGLPDFHGDKYPCTAHYVCTKCGEPCDIKQEKIVQLDSVDKLFKELEEDRKAHLIYYFFHDIYWRIYHFIDDIPLRVKTFIQRGKRGWANSDTWGFDYYLAKVISEGIHNLKEHIHGMPNGLTEGQWIDILNKITYTFESAKRMTENELYLIKNRKQRKEWQESLDEINKKHGNRDRCMTNKEIREYGEGWRLFKE